MNLTDTERVLLDALLHHYLIGLRAQLRAALAMQTSDHSLRVVRQYQAEIEIAEDCLEKIRSKLVLS